MPSFDNLYGKNPDGSEYQNVSLTGSNVVNGGQVKTTLYNSAGLEPYIGSGIIDDSPNVNTAFINARQSVFNGSNWDRVRNNTQGTLLASAARTASLSSANQINYNGRGVVLFLKITVAPNTAETLKLSINNIEPISGVNWGDVANFTTTAGSTITSGQLFQLIVYPGASGATADTLLKAVALPIPRTWQSVITPSGASSWTYSLAYSIIL